jgi:hypothetical protein
MSQTLTRELNKKIFDILELAYQDNPPSEDARMYNHEQADKLTEAILELRAFKTPTARVDRSAEEQEELDRKKENWLFPANQAEVDETVFAKEAVDSFESCLHFNPLDWYSNDLWTKFAKFVVAEYKKDVKIWEKYETWRKGEGQYKGAMTNPKIQMNPKVFIASSFPAFLAHTGLYGKKSGAEVQVDADGAPITF